VVSINSASEAETRKEVIDEIPRQRHGPINSAKIFVFFSFGPLDFLWQGKLLILW